MGLKPDSFVPSGRPAPSGAEEGCLHGLPCVTEVSGMAVRSRSTTTALTVPAALTYCLALLVAPAAHAQEAAAADQPRHQRTAHSVAGLVLPTAHRGPDLHLAALLDAYRSMSPGRSVAAAQSADPGPDTQQLASDSLPLVGDNAVATAGDLDGDGLQDLLSFDYRQGQEGVQARRGTDGSLIWARPLQGDFTLGASLGQDVTGDGIDDLLLFTRDVTSVDFGLVDGGTYYDAEYDYTYGVRSGRDGGTLWSTTTKGSSEEATRRRDGTTRYSYRSAGEVLAPVVSDDVTGDGLADLVLNELNIDIESSDSRGALVVAQREDQTSTTRVDGRGVLLDGRDGSRTTLRQVTNSTSLPLLLPVGQVGGSAGADLLWLVEELPDVDSSCLTAYDLPLRHCTGAQAGTERIVAELLADGASTATWRATTPGRYPHLVPSGDVDGDGGRDLVLQSFSNAGTAVLSGRTGQVLWTHVGNREPAQFLGADHAAGSRPVAVLGYVVPQGNATPADSTDVVVERRDAGTGALLTTDRRTMDVRNDGSDAPVYTVAQFALLPAPGQDELLVATSSGRRDPNGSPRLLYRSTVRIEGLADGVQRAEDRGDTDWLWSTAGDLDGDARTDVLRSSMIDDRPAEMQTAFAAGLQRLWQAEVPFRGLDLAGDLDGDRGDELLAVLDDGEDRALVSLNGRDLTLRWRHRLP